MTQKGPRSWRSFHVLVNGAERGLLPGEMAVFAAASVWGEWHDAGSGRIAVVVLSPAVPVSQMSMKGTICA